MTAKLKKATFNNENKSFKLSFKPKEQESFDWEKFSNGNIGGYNLKLNPTIKTKSQFDRVYSFESYAKDNVASGKTLSVYNLLKEVFDLRFIANTNSQNYIDSIIVNSPNTATGNPQLLQTFLSHALSSQEFLIK